MRTKGHELKLKNGLALKSASNSFAIALCRINSPEKYNKEHTQEAGTVALDSAIGNLMNRNIHYFIFRMFMSAPKNSIFTTVKSIPILIEV